MQIKRHIFALKLIVDFVNYIVNANEKHALCIMHMCTQLYMLVVNKSRII